MCVSLAAERSAVSSISGTCSTRAKRSAIRTFSPVWRRRRRHQRRARVESWDLPGEGVVVAVIDTGVQIIHPDLLANISPTLRYNAITGTNNVSPDFDRSRLRSRHIGGRSDRRDVEQPGRQVLDSNGNPVFDVDGNPVYTGGGVGVAPNVTIVPIKLVATRHFGPGHRSSAFQYALENGVDITNNSWGRPTIARSRY